MINVIRGLGTTPGVPPVIFLAAPPPLMQHGSIGANQTVINSLYPVLSPVIAQAANLSTVDISIYEAMGGTPGWAAIFPSSCTLNSPWPACNFYCDKQSCDQVRRSRRGPCPRHAVPPLTRARPRRPLPASSTAVPPQRRGLHAPGQGHEGGAGPVACASTSAGREAWRGGDCNEPRASSLNRGAPCRAPPPRRPWPPAPRPRAGPPRRTPRAAPFCPRAPRAARP